MSLLEAIDSVYFLIIPGWENELRANRWHFAVRWAKRKPVVLVSPMLRGGPSASVAEARIPNCRILRTQLVSEPNQLAKAQIQLGQVLEDMNQHHHSRTLLWCYDPDLAELYARTPAIARVHHATEAFFDMPARSPAQHRRQRAVVAMSDLTVAVSEGIAAGIQRAVPDADVVTVRNGCDFQHYSAGKADADLVASARGYERVAIYAGNVNGRLDFRLLARLAAENARVLFAVYGPVNDLPPADQRAWQQLAELKNVLAAGAVDPDRLRDLYMASDVGLIPYRQDPWLVENGMPLKALEMCATGLPVVSTLMKPLVGLAKGLTVVSSQDEFMAAFASTSRKTLPPAVADELKAVSEANDYDRKFDQVLAALDARVTPDRPVTRLDRLIEAMGMDWTDAEIRFARWLTMPQAARAFGAVAGSAALLLPTGLRRRLAGSRLRAAVRQLLGS